ncbi:MAG TPA: plastocyanin/azurin family copper-binding protein, partial [Chloroflexia bacterium]|nr:plastocyanin/azurin family copper-binding protein [Chloroflexia bacterium]
MRTLRFTSTTRWKQVATAVAAMLVIPMLSPFYVPQAANAAVVRTVEMKDFKFKSPGSAAKEGDTVNVSVGDAVTWINADAESHNIAILDGPDLNVSPEQKTGEKWSMSFNKAGRYHYYCEFHPWMFGDVIVGGNTSTASTERAALTFRETTKSVRGKFLSYWQKNGGLPQQGFPISEEMQERSDTDGKFYTVQYTERAVFELHPEKAAPYDVLLSLLGNFEYKRKYPNGAPGQQPNTTKGSIQFKETGKHLGGRFLEYWQKNGGLAQQGFPISDEFTEKSDLNGQTYRVQYFERAVFELHPENKAPYDVLLSQLGKFRYDKVAAKPASSGVHQIGVAANEYHYPLMAGPHAAPGVNVWIYDQDPTQVTTWTDEMGAKW